MEIQSPAASSSSPASVDNLASCTDSSYEMTSPRDHVNTAALTSSSEDPSSDCDALKTDFDAFCRFAFTHDNQHISNDVSSTSSADQPFYFESDHVALRTNEDYRRLMRAFVSLQSERTAALQELDSLLDAQQRALRDPLDFVSQLSSGTWTNQLPRRRPHDVTELPTVAWERYTSDVECVLASLGVAAGQSMTRLKHKKCLMTGIRASDEQTSQCATGRSDNSDGPVTRTDSDGSLSTTSNQSETCKPPHPVTYNQPWSVEEQRHLEHLLEKYPPERFEARRFSKIASELPGRTTQQVTSRVQKYFIKLAKAGLPVPGRIPNLAAYGGRWFTGRYHGHHHHRHHHFYFPSSTFLTSYAPPVYMSDDDSDNNDDDDDNGHASLSATLTDNDVRGHSVSMLDDSMSVLDNSDIPECLRDTDEYRQLRTLTALHQSVHLHTPGGSTVQSSTSQSHIDSDYMCQSTGVSSYLDPNYMPAI